MKKTTLKPTEMKATKLRDIKVDIKLIQTI